MMTPSRSLGIEIADVKEQAVQRCSAAELPEAARWRAAEGRLYPLIVVDPVLYEAAVTLVCEAADVLRWRCGTVSELVGVDASAVLASCPSAPVMSALGVDPGTAFDAACAYRWRELTADQTDPGLDAGHGGSR
jgi:hypothetical protein